MNLPSDGDEVAPVKRQGAEQAIQLALESKWEEAAALNRSIVQTTPNDVDAWNRLGKSLLELGRYREAHDAYAQSMQLDPVNQIARRNLERLAGLQDVEAPRAAAPTRVAQDMFIEEVGKTGTTVLHNVPQELARTLDAGDEVFLKPGDDVIRVEIAGGEVIGDLEAKMALRLLRLIEGGNQYAAAVRSVADTDVEVIIKETFRHPSQTRLSFPAAGTSEAVRPYIKESLLRLSDDDDEIDEDTGDEDVEPDTDSEESLSFSSMADDDVDDDDDEG